MNVRSFSSKIQIGGICGPGSEQPTSAEDLVHGSQYYGGGIENSPVTTKKARKYWLSMLKTMFKEMAKPSTRKHDTLDKHTFLNYFPLPGLLGERLFAIFDRDHSDTVDFHEFFAGLAMIYNGSAHEKKKFLFDMYDLDDNGYVSREELKIMLYHIPAAVKILDKYCRVTENIEDISIDEDEERLQRDDFQQRIESIVFSVFDLSENDDTDLDFRSNVSSVSSMPTPEHDDETSSYGSYTTLTKSEPSSCFTFRGWSDTSIIQSVENDTCSSNNEFLKESVRQIYKNKLQVPEDKNKAFKRNKSFKQRSQHKSHLGLDFEQFCEVIEKYEEIFGILDIFYDKHFPELPVPLAAMNKQTYDKQASGKRKYFRARWKTTIPKLSVTPAKSDRIVTPRMEVSSSEEDDTSIDGNSDERSRIGFSYMKPSTVPSSSSFADVDSLNYDSASGTCSNNRSYHPTQSLRNLSPASRCSSHGDLRKASGHQGWLYKLGRRLGFKSWRFYVLRDRFLYYFYHVSSTIPRKVLFLEGYFVSAYDMENKHRYGIEIKSDSHPIKKRYLFAMDRLDRDNWLYHLTLASNTVSVHQCYTFDEILGKGKYGTVYAAVSKSTRRRVAIKVIQRSQLTYENREFLYNEVAILQLLDHPNIIKCLNVFKSEHYLYLVMEGIWTGNLKSFYADMNNLSGPSLEAVTQPIVKDILRAVEYLHRFRIVHRDIKPENILVKRKSFPMYHAKSNECRLTSLSTFEPVIMKNKVKPCEKLSEAGDAPSDPITKKFKTLNDIDKYLVDNSSRKGIMKRSTATRRLSKAMPGFGVLAPRSSIDNSQLRCIRLNLVSIGSESRDGIVESEMQESNATNSRSGTNKNTAGIFSVPGCSFGVVTPSSSNGSTRLLKIKSHLPARLCESDVIIGKTFLERDNDEVSCKETGDVNWTEESLINDIDCVKVTDFGLSKLTAQNTLHEPLGSLAYAAPEIVSGCQYDKAVDMWSVGVVVYEMLSGGILPFHAESSQELADAVIQGTYSLNSAEWSRISEDAKSFVRGLLCVDAKKRLSATDALDHKWLRRVPD